jgi:Ca-activated chloride channel family protein
LRAIAFFACLVVACVASGQQVPPQSTLETQKQSAPPAMGAPAPNDAANSKPTTTPNATTPENASQNPAPSTQPQAAQLPVDSTYEEVHITPRIDSSGAKEGEGGGGGTGGGAPSGAAAPSTPTPSAIVDPSLKTHTKPLKVDVDLVLVPVTITDPMNRLVTGLDKENFVVMDNGEKQDIRHFSTEDAPISLGVLFDMSGSMSDKIEKSREAVVQFFKTANPEDEFFLIAFNDKPQVVSDFTQSIEQIQGDLAFTVPKGRTSLLDAVYLGIAKMKQAKHQRKALLIISDGGDNHSRYTENEILSQVKEADVQIFAIGLFDSSPMTDEERMGPHMLADITDVTGGRTFTINSANELADVATKIGVELRNQYVLGYRPKSAGHDGKWRKIRVKLNPPKSMNLPPLTVYAKTGYYAPNH